MRFSSGSAADEDVVEFVGETEAVGVVNNPPFGWFGIPTNNFAAFVSGKEFEGSYGRLFAMFFNCLS